MGKIKDLLITIDEKDIEIADLKDFSKKFFQEYTNFKTDIAILLGYEIAKIHYLSVDDLVVKVFTDKIIYTHLKNESFNYQFQDFKDIITYLVAELKLERNHRKINLVSVDEKGITVKKADMGEIHTHLRDVLGE
jgi:hypothetical protein